MAAERRASRGEGEAMGWDTYTAVQLHCVVLVSLPARLTDAAVDRDINVGG